jgi:hypothetical protein
VRMCLTSTNGSVGKKNGQTFLSRLSYRWIFVIMDDIPSALLSIIIRFLPSKSKRALGDVNHDFRALVFEDRFWQTGKLELYHFLKGGRVLGYPSAQLEYHRKIDITNVTELAEVADEKCTAIETKGELVFVKVVGRPKTRCAFRPWKNPEEATTELLKHCNFQDNQHRVYFRNFIAMKLIPVVVTHVGLSLRDSVDNVMMFMKTRGFGSGPLRIKDMEQWKKVLLFILNELPPIRRFT